MLKMTKLLTVS